MKFVVDQLPYYEEFCPLYMMCGNNASDDKCPRYWDKYKVCSDDNPHECHLLIEVGDPAFMEGHVCQTCKHFEDPDVLSSQCSICFGFSEWEAKNER